MVHGLTSRCILQPELVDPVTQKGVLVSLSAAGVAVSLVGIVRVPEVTVVVAITMVLIVLVGSLIGMSLPSVFTRLGWDPAGR